MEYTRGERPYSIAYFPQSQGGNALASTNTAKARELFAKEKKYPAAAHVLE